MSDFSQAANDLSAVIADAIFALITLERAVMALTAAVAAGARGAIVAAAAEVETQVAALRYALIAAPLPPVS